MSNYLLQRGKRFYFQRRVPIHLRELDPRPIIRIALKTTDAREASRQAHVHNDYLEAFWRDLAAKGEAYQDAAFKRCVALARVHGFAYKSAVDIAQGHRDDIVGRIQTIEESDGDQLANLIPALLGGAERPEIMLSDCIERFWPLCQDKLVGKSEHQIKKWKNPRAAAMKNFIAAVGNKGLADVTRNDVLLFREWWMKKIAAKTHNPLSANKQLIAVKTILHAVARGAGMENDFRPLFADTRLKPQVQSRASYDPAFIQDSILAPGKLDGLNDDAKWIIHAMADTGARPSELTGLLPEDIILDAEIPHIWIRPRDEHMLKTPQSERKIPLVGAALVAFQSMPNGFRRYQHADSLSNLVNKYLDHHGLRPTKRHSLYSFRHAFKDRLRDAGAPEEIIDELMGHEGDRPKYGRGHLLESKLAWLEKIAFRVTPR